MPRPVSLSGAIIRMAQDEPELSRNPEQVTGGAPWTALWVF